MNKGRRLVDDLNAARLVQARVKKRYSVALALHASRRSNESQTRVESIGAECFAATMIEEPAQVAHEGYGMIASPTAKNDSDVADLFG